MKINIVLGQSIAHQWYSKTIDMQQSSVKSASLLATRSLDASTA